MATEKQTPDFTNQLTALLDKLVPPDDVTVRTVDGRDVKLPGAISARKQVVVFRIIKELSELPQLANAMTGVRGGGTAALLDAVVALATDEVVADKLGKAFAAAYPEVLDGRDPLDLLPIEELAASLLPFSERFVRRLGQGMTVLATGTQGMQLPNG
tara:strand:+ start:2418 stop:2888 length:471 start_codon:yes stop_codon:yes gene_type:complete